jgi:hypothetical protein
MQKAPPVKSGHYAFVRAGRQDGARRAADDADAAMPSARCTAYRDAGAIIFGKTNTPALAGDLQTFNAIFGTTNTRGTPRAQRVARPVARPRRWPPA